MNRLTEIKLGENYPRAYIAEYVTRVHGHIKATYSNHNNSAADCSISLKFGIMSQVIHFGLYGAIQMLLLLSFNVQGQRSRSQRKVRYQAKTL